MHHIDPSPLSLWQSLHPLTSFPRLARTTSCDVCVIGAGIAGLSTAYALTCEGKSVVLIDDGDVCGGQTCRTTAHLSNVIDDRFVELERIRGTRVAQLAAESHAAAIDRIESIVMTERIDCGFERVDGFLFLPPGRDAHELDAEFDAARRAGATVERCARVPVAALATGPCLWFARQAQLDPVQYTAGLARAIVARGGQIYCETHATKVRGGSPCHVECGNIEVIAQAVVTATNIPFNDRVAVHTKLAAYTTYVISARVDAPPNPAVLLWDSEDPYHYVRWDTANGVTELIVGGEDHRSGQQLDDPHEPHRRLESWMRERFPEAGLVTSRWVGQVVETLDGLAFIGKDPGHAENVYIATGDSGMGMTHGTIAGMILSDLITDHANVWSDAYDSRRKPVAATPKFVRENVSTVGHYAEWLMPGEKDDAPRVHGTGTVIKRGVHPIAVYTDEAGQSVEMSAVCPHLGCIVHWNDADKSWNCPCHGSRFDAFGCVVNGPANRPLARSDCADDQASDTLPTTSRELPPPAA